MIPFKVLDKRMARPFSDGRIVPIDPFCVVPIEVFTTFLKKLRAHLDKPGSVTTVPSFLVTGWLSLLCGHIILWLEAIVNKPKGLNGPIIGKMHDGIIYHFGYVSFRLLTPDWIKLNRKTIAFAEAVEPHFWRPKGKAKFKFLPVRIVTIWGPGRWANNEEILMREDSKVVRKGFAFSGRLLSFAGSFGGRRK